MFIILRDPRVRISEPDQDKQEHRRVVLQSKQLRNIINFCCSQNANRHKYKFKNKSKIYMLKIIVSDFHFQGLKVKVENYSQPTSL